MHGNMANSMKQRRGPASGSSGRAGVHQRLRRTRASSEKILLVISGEFGRTPAINQAAEAATTGARSATLALSGGGLRMGQAVGESTANAEVPKSTAITRKT